jgi:hypothetical protein
MLGFWTQGHLRDNDTRRVLELSEAEIPISPARKDAAVGGQILQ